jgi:hypothetical protein
MDGDSSSPPPESVAGLLAQLADRLSVELAGAATVESTEFLDGGGVGWDLRPVNPRSVPVTWLLWGDGILLQVGRLDRGGRWELDHSVDAVRFVESVASAAVAGRVTETSALSRSRIEVTVDDGRVVHETGLEGCLAVLVPLPGWRRWGKVERFQPYRQPW